MTVWLHSGTSLTMNATDYVFGTGGECSFMTLTMWLTASAGQEQTEKDDKFRMEPSIL